MPAKHPHKHTRNQAGAVMLFALLILSVMAAIGFAISALVYREVNVARSFDDSLQSYYAAETGIERGLDIVVTHRQAHDQLSDTLTAIMDYATAVSPVTMTSSNASYAIDPLRTTSTTDSISTPIRDFFQIDLYDPDNSVTSLMDAESMRMLWNIPSSCSASTRMEITYQQFNSSSFGLSDDSVYKQVYTCGVEIAPAGYDCQVTSNWPAANTNYIVQIHSLDCSYVDATMTFYDADDAGGVVVAIPSIIDIASIGTGDVSQREIVAHTKWIPSTSGLSAFVLFSLEAVAK